MNNSNNEEFSFNYTSRTGKNLIAPCLANQTEIIDYNDGHWLVYRMKEAPYDCILAIQNNTYDNSGDYECVGHFFIDGKIENISSNQKIKMCCQYHLLSHQERTKKFTFPYS